MEEREFCDKVEDVLRWMNVSEELEGVTDAQLKVARLIAKQLAVQGELRHLIYKVYNMPASSYPTKARWELVEMGKLLDVDIGIPTEVE